MNKSIAAEKEEINGILRYQIKDAIRFVGINSKLSGGWKDHLLDPVVEDIISRINEKVLDHIASVARQEGREEAIEEIKAYFPITIKSVPWKESSNEFRKRLFSVLEKLKQNENG